MEFNVFPWLLCKKCKAIFRDDLQQTGFENVMEHHEISELYRVADPEFLYYASALLVPCWQFRILGLHAGPVAWIMLFLLVSSRSYWFLDSFFFWLPQCWGLPVRQLAVFPHLLLV